MRASAETVPRPTNFELRRTRAKSKRVKRPSLTNDDRQCLRDKAELLSCSDPWTLAMLKELDECGVMPRAPMREIERRLKELGIYPPPAENTPMRRCRFERFRYYPPQYITSQGSCEDHALYDYWKRFKWLQDNGLTAEKAKKSEVISNRFSCKGRGTSSFPGDETDVQHVTTDTAETENPLVILRRIGLTEKMIVVLSLSRERRSQRDIAAIAQVSQTWVSFLLSKALSLIAQAGLSLPDLKPHVPEPSPKVVLMSPESLDKFEAV
jgi:hypothetical protein